MNLQPDSNATVEVSASARLHLGFFDLNGECGRSFGSLGLSLDAPRTTLSLCRAAIGTTATTATSTGPERERAARYLTTVCRHLGIEGAHDLSIVEAIPSHSGLGSGTQLALAVAASVRRLHGLPLDTTADAGILERGRRSGIGIGAFDAGGVVVDGGRGSATHVPPIIARLTFPAAWRVLLIFDRAHRGVHGTAEHVAFEALPPMPRAHAADACHLVLMQALPALAEHDIVGFGRAVRALQRRLGAHFAPHQGGAPFTSPAVAEALALLDDAGAHGTGQSSWGPTGFAFAPDTMTAEGFAKVVRAGLPELGIRVTSGRNRGADISQTATAPTRR